MDRDAAYYATLEKSLQDLDLAQLIRAHGPYHPSPVSWEDEVLYFLMLDRFSDGREGGGFKDINGNPVNGGGGRTTALFRFPDDAYTADRQQWFENGKKWCGGTLAGLKDKLGYLKRLGVTVIWISPVFKQVWGSQNDYHGYGIQNFLDVDPHYGRRDELRDLVSAAHEQGIRVILDIILNHAGDVFAYKGGQEFSYQRDPIEVDGYKREQADGRGSLPFREIDLARHPDAWPHGAIWPREFQAPDTWTRKGKIGDWNAYPEYLEGDFDKSKNIHLGYTTEPVAEWDKHKMIRSFKRLTPLEHLCQVYLFWIAYADIDGYRLDTVKHMDPGSVRYFVNVVHEFAQRIGKENFYVIGEITFDRSETVNLVDLTGLNAALGIDGVQEKLEGLAKGMAVPGNPEHNRQEGYFDLFNNSVVDGKATHQWYSRRVVTMFEDHDQVYKTHKYRYCGDRSGQYYNSLPLAMALNLTTAGIPCIYYGTEQAFDGSDHRTDPNDKSYSDVFLRECMFGGPFGSLQSTNRHFFNEDHPVYRWVRKLCALRRQQPALRRGRQYLQKVSASGRREDLYYPSLIGGELRWVIGWTRAFADTELLCAINTNMQQALTVWITIEKGKQPNAPMRCICATDPALEGHQAQIDESRGFSGVQVTVPAGGVVIYEKIR